MTRDKITQEMPEVFRGHFDECLTHFGTFFQRRFPRNSNGAHAAKKPVADFCGVSSHTVTRWLYSNQSPVGEVLIRLMCYLDFLGYKVIELENMPKAVRNFAELIGYRIISGNQAAEIAGYSSASTLYDVFYGDSGISEGKKKKMWESWKERRGNLERKRAESEIYRVEITPETSSQTQRTLDSSSMSIGNVSSILLSMLKEKMDDVEIPELLESEETIHSLRAYLDALSAKLVALKQKGTGGKEVGDGGQG